MSRQCDEKPPTDPVARLFPLGGTVLFPHGLLSLHIFEPRYRQMTEHALESDRSITMILPVRPDAPEPVPIASVGCLGKILQERRLPDGRFKFLLQGTWRVRIRRELPMQFLYRRADVEVLEDHWKPGLATRREFQRADVLQSMRKLLQPSADDENANQFFQYLTDRCGAGAFADIVTHATPMELTLKQDLLEQSDVDIRLERLADCLREMVKGQAREDSRQVPFQFPPGFSQN